MDIDSTPDMLLLIQQKFNSVRSDLPLSTILSRVGVAVNVSADVFAGKLPMSDSLLPLLSTLRLTSI